MFRLVLLLVVLVGAPLLRAQVKFTVTAAATSTAESYISGNTYNFVFTTCPSFTTLGNSTFDSSHQTWVEEVTTDDQLWASVAGTGLLGAFVRPTGDFEDPYSFAGITAQRLNLYAGTDGVSTTDIGLTTLAGTPLIYVSIKADGGNLPTFDYPGPGTSLQAYFSAYSGTYASGFDAGDIVELSDFFGSSYVSFNITSIDIASIPEPTTYAALVGLAVFGLVGWHRRRALS